MTSRVDMGAGIKGAAFREFLRWYATRAPDRIAAVAAEVPDLGLDVSRDGLGILPGSWYPATVVHRALDVLLAEVAASERPVLARAGARATMDATLHGIYKLLFRALSTPSIYVRHAQRVFARFYDRGTLTVTLTPNGADSVIEGWPAHHQFICEMNLHAATFIYEAMGCRGVATVHLGCVSSGARACGFRTTWAHGE